MNRNIIVFLPLLALVACGTPQERCISSNTREYRVLRSLLAESEANLARGYAWRERSVVRTQLETCHREIINRDGKPRTVGYDCWRDVVDTERYREPIDPAAERRTRDNLAQKLKVQTAQAKDVVNQCKANYPEAS